MASRRSRSQSSARDDVGDFGRSATPRQNLRAAVWAQETLAQLESAEPTPRERRRRDYELREDFTERAAIFEYLANLPRAVAETRARELVYGAA